MPNEPSIKRDLKATADLLDALQNDPRLLEDADFIRRLSILRQKHEETTNFLARKVGAPELRTTTSSTLTTSIQKTQRVEKSEVSYQCPRDPRVNVPIRIAPPPPVPRGFRTAPASRGNSGFSRENSEFLTSSAYNGASESSMRRSTSSFTSQSTVREILSKVKEKYELLPESLMLTNTHGSVARNSKMSNSKSAPKLHSEIVEESFLSDALSTTREVPTIVDEVVEVSERPKIAHVTHIQVRQLPEQRANYKVPEIRLKIDKKRSKSMQNVAEPKNEYVPQTTVPKPFQLSLRKSTGNTYAKKFMDEMMEEKKKIEEEDSNAVKNTKFRAKPVPKSTYIPTNVFATEQKYVEAMRKKIGKMAKAKFDAQNEMVRSKSESNLASIKPLGYVPPSTYISPIPVKPNARSRSATTRSAILIQEATTPKGIKSHRHTSNLTHNLRHGRCKIDVTTAIQHRRVSPPDFDKIHAKINEEYRKTNSKPSTVPIPFKFESRSQSAHTHKRHQNCQGKEPEQFAKQKSRKSISSAEKRIPSTHAAQLREELSKSKIQKEKLEKEQNSGEFWKEDNRKRISSFLGARSKTDEDIAIRTRRKIQQQQETTQEYMRQLAQMKQRVLNGPLIMEKQTALAQEHRLKRKFEARMKTTTSRITTSSDLTISPKSSQKSPKSSGKTSKKSSKSSSRRNSEISSGGGTFVVEKDEYSEDFDEEDSESETSSESDEKSTEEGSEEGSEEEEEH